MNRESSPRLSAILSEEQKLTQELAGLTEISMQAEALVLCRRFLCRRWVSPDGFHEVMRVIGMFGSKKRWASRLEAAFARQSARIRRVLEGTMLFFYAGFGDWRNALRFASMRNDLLPHEIALAIEAFARAGRVREVRRLGMRIERWVERIDSSRRPRHAQYELGFLLYGLGIYKTQGCYAKEAWLRELGREEALSHWSAVFVGHSLGPAAGYNAIDLLLCMVLEKVNRRISRIREVDGVDFDSTALSLPGNQEKLNAEMLARFNRCRRALERLVPEKRRKELGMDRPSPEG
jgi:hypothetical protein